MAEGEKNRLPVVGTGFTFGEYALVTCWDCAGGELSGNEVPGPRTALATVAGLGVVYLPGLSGGVCLAGHQDVAGDTGAFGRCGRRRLPRPHQQLHKEDEHERQA